MEELKLNITGDQKELVIRTGAALPLKEPIPVILSGQIDTVLNYLEKRKDRIDQKRCFISIDKDKYKILLVVNENSFYATEISGKLELSTPLKEFGINSEKIWTPFELADFIRMNKMYFEKTSDATNLIKVLRNFEVKVNQEIKMSEDKRANQNLLRSQVVETNLPKGFNLVLPVFKGTEKEVISIEVDIDSTSYNCRLVSPRAKDAENRISDNIIEVEVTGIIELCPEIVIINL